MELKPYNPSGFALEIFRDRYAIHPEETFDEACHRVARYIASAEEGEKIGQYESKFFNILNTARLCPGGRILRGAGRPKSQMLNCWILERDSLDSREGWGSIIKDVIILSGTGGGCGINFSKIRPRGAPIRGLGGESTGSVSLMKMINAVVEELRSGGNRRAALMACLDWNHPDCLEFLEAKLDKKQLNNANISICIDNEFLDLVEQDKEIIFQWNDKEYGRAKAKDVWKKIIDNALVFGDPGILNRGFANEQNNLYYLKEGELVATNPCLPKKSMILTQNGIKPISSIDVGDYIWSQEGWTKIINIIDQGVKPVYKFETTLGFIEATKDHKIVNNGTKVIVSNADGIDSLSGQSDLTNIELDSQDIMDGMMVGDGYYHNKNGAGSPYPILCIGDNDHEYFQSEIKHLIKYKYDKSCQYGYKVKTTIAVDELPLKPYIKVPDRFYYGNLNKVIGFLRGIYTANGSFVDGRITLKASSKYLIYQIQQMLSSIGIRSYYTTNKSKKIKFSNGEYVCKESYDLNITRDRKIFAKYIGYIQTYKQKQLDQWAQSHKSASRAYGPGKIKNIEYIGDMEVVDITVDNNSHTFWCNGFNVANCGEIYGIENDCCNLSSINLHRHVVDEQINWNMLDETIRLAVRFLDNTLTQNYFPIKKMEETCKKIRRIGVGVFGLHDMLLELGIKYSSSKALEIVDKVLSFIKEKAYDASIMLATEKGSFPALDRKKFIESEFCKKSLTPSIRRKILKNGLRNCAILDIAPTGTTSILCGVSSGIEPMFAPIYRRRFNKHKNQHNEQKESSEEIIVHPLLKKFIEQKRDYSHFEATHEISPEQHIAMQRVCQKHIDNSLSKTINLPSDFKGEDLSSLILSSIRELKGITVYRSYSRENSPLEPLPIKEATKYLNQINTKTEITDNSCPTGKCDI